MQKQEDKKEILYTIQGNVQGVFFRKFAQEKARELGITGYAKNNNDGSVEILAQGTPENLQVFTGFMNTGTENAEVESVNILKGPAGESYSSFDIL